ncbi:CDP-diacylglycerol--glycerol-3-phosphate 3-phosphatidyltransferase [Rickettsiales endosymbiont of Peranema trichophorum]|uniref:CDP-diacylglycerol--glycerol-3-phosphate 3-phosphatidyltransferase n=1 Tax=Rickettsiales endosymbiont of Peranema trichophorum TaxID=2486577 RepID=UPI001022EFD3|nr:CDP-diacylglycerol--glycerol-3-phosphate 3-phosphatidyltransferase [Rickettsiales endosymbiont of Peranema trichophorum]RZI46787.1 CDP-diacylglycerol--glycerol-3-phosphate 3-phosphatidyltransferase [Rickettsiales endosymbiont of Peranema trichophorum]
MEMNKIPNLLTLFRILLIPTLIFSFYLKGELSSYVAVAIFVFASITDFFDGYIARRMSTQSELGRMLDPIADKLLIASTLMMLVHFQKAPVIPSIAILCREILVSGLREHLAEIRILIPVSSLAKIKTAAQMAAIIILLLGEDVFHIPYINIFGQGMLWIAAILTLITGYVYCKEGIKHI